MSQIILGLLSLIVGIIPIGYYVLSLYAAGLSRGAGNLTAPSLWWVAFGAAFGLLGLALLFRWAVL